MTFTKRLREMPVRNASKIQSQESCIHPMLSHAARFVLRRSRLRSRHHERKETKGKG